MSAPIVWVVKARDGSAYLGPIECPVPQLRYSTVLRLRDACRFPSWRDAANAILADFTCGDGGWHPVRLRRLVQCGGAVVKGWPCGHVHSLSDDVVALPKLHPFAAGDRVRVTFLRVKGSHG